MPYYESHITVEPIFDERLDRFKALCKQQGFRVADLLMQKRKEDTPERSRFDTFCTGRDPTYWDLHYRMVALLGFLKQEGFKVWRYKIEHAILDSREDDSIFPISPGGGMADTPVSKTGAP